MTTTIGGLAAGYAEGWLTGAFPLPHSSFQFDIGQSRFGFAEQPFALDGIFGNEFPIELTGADFEQFLKCGADGGFVLDAEFFKLRQIVVIGTDNLVRGFQC
jgi:hypothetical protein